MFLQQQARCKPATCPATQSNGSTVTGNSSYSCTRIRIALQELKAAKDKAANEQAAKDAVDEDAADEEEMRQLDKQPEVEISEDDKRGAQAFVEAMEASAKSASEIDGPPEDDDGPEEGKADVV